jgi:hypothetical protein
MDIEERSVNPLSRSINPKKTSTNNKEHSDKKEGHDKITEEHQKKIFVKIEELLSENATSNYLIEFDKITLKAQLLTESEKLNFFFQIKQDLFKNLNDAFFYEPLECSIEDEIESGILETIESRGSLKSEINTLSREILERDFFRMFLEFRRDFLLIKKLKNEIDLLESPNQQTTGLESTLNSNQQDLKKINELQINGNIETFKKDMVNLFTRKNPKNDKIYLSETDIDYFIKQNFAASMGVKEIKTFTPNMNKCQLSQAFWILYEKYHLSKQKKLWYNVLNYNFPEKGITDIGNFRDYYINYIKLPKL